MKHFIFSMVVAIVSFSTFAGGWHVRKLVGNQGASSVYYASGTNGGVSDFDGDKWDVDVPAGKTATVTISYTGGSLSTWANPKKVSLIIRDRNGKGKAIGVRKDDVKTKSMTLESSNRISINADCMGLKNDNPSLNTIYDVKFHSASCRLNYTIKVEYSGGDGNNTVKPKPKTTPAPTTCKITFNANGGKLYEMDFFGANGTTKTYVGTSTYYNVYKGSKLLSKAPVCEKSGFSFLGWWTSSSGGVKIGEGDTVTQTKTLYAHWRDETKKVTITFKPNGGEGSLGPQVLYAGTAKALLKNSKITRRGYSFKGWSTSSSRMTVDYADGATITRNSDLTLFAVWEPQPVTITFDDNWSGGGMSVAQYTPGTMYGSLPSPEGRAGYSFLGWYSVYGTKITATFIVPDSAATLYAKWQKNYTYLTVSFLKNDGSGETADCVTYELHDDEDAVYGALSIPSRTGYAFDGWWTAATGGERIFSYSPVMKNVTNMYAHWVKAADYGGAAFYAVPSGEQNVNLGEISVPCLVSGDFVSSSYGLRDEPWQEWSPSNMSFYVAQSAWQTIRFNSEVNYLRSDERRTMTIALLEDGVRELGMLESSGSFSAYLDRSKTYTIECRLSGDCKRHSIASPINNHYKFTVQIGGDVALIPTIGIPQAPRAYASGNGIALSWQTTSDADIYHVYRRRRHLSSGKGGDTGKADYEYLASTFGTTYFDASPFGGYPTDYYILAEKNGAISGASAHSAMVTVPVVFNAYVYESKIAATRSTGYICVNANTVWSVESDSEWLSIPNYLGDCWGDTYIPYEAEENTGAFDRVATISFGDRGTVTITQKGLGEEVSVPIGKAGSSRSYTEGETYDDLPEVEERPGYSFIGWSTTEDGEEILSPDSVVLRGSTLYDIWRSNIYTIHYDANGGTGQMDDQSVITFFPFALDECAFKKDGKVFLGWSLEANGEVAYDDEDVVENLTLEDGSTVTLYAVWGDEAQWFGPWGMNPDVASGGSRLVALNITYPLKKDGDVAALYDTEGRLRAVGKVSSNILSVSLQCEESERFACAVWRNGTDLEDIEMSSTWWTAGGQEDASSFNFSTVRARTLPPLPRTITFNPNGGRLENTSIEVAHGTSIGPLPFVEKEKNIFAGWWTDEKKGVRVTAETIVTNDMTLYAHWTAAWTVTLNANGGTLEGESGAASSLKLLKAKGKAVGTLPTPAKAGYAFKGWHTKKSGGTKITTKTKVTKNITWYAQWTVKKYKVAVKKVGKGTVSGAGSKAYKSKVTLKAKAASGYVFQGWYLDDVLKSQKATYSFTAPLDGVTYTAKFITKAADKAGIGMEFGGVGFGAMDGGSGSPALPAMTNVCGVVTTWPVAASGLTAVSVSVSGQPKGMKYDAKKKAVTGVATVANKSGTMKITVKSAGASRTWSVKWRTVALPTWAVGTFRGTLYDGEGAVSKGTVTLTVGTTGKVSGKFVDTKKKSYAFSVASFKTFEDGVLRTKATMKYGKKSVTVEIAVGLDSETSVGFAEVGSTAAPFSGQTAVLAK